MAGALGLGRLCKSALAATVAWWIAHDLLHAKSPAFAPFSAVLIMNVTVYQSRPCAATVAFGIAPSLHAFAGHGVRVATGVLALCWS
ncbi:hypothetical protein [Streptomyces sp. 135]|uniref:hypothetical protein n=1 Tax=Streptomyces sp. 135 TaxID=2838850 RepID=UPI001CBFA08C|nr:hypothetical protein [Streptomyces sp. 135]